MANGQAQRAVVIEDDVDVRHLLEAVLSQAGFDPILTSNGEDGIEAVRAYNPIITTLDINMPGVDGFEVARRLRTFSRTYIIMLTALDEEIDAIQGLDAGADEYIVKPFRPREFRARINSLMRRHQMLSAPTEPAPSPAVPQPDPSLAHVAQSSLVGDVAPVAPVAPLQESGEQPLPYPTPVGQPDPYLHPTAQEPYGATPQAPSYPQQTAYTQQGTYAQPPQQVPAQQVPATRSPDTIEYKGLVLSPTERTVTVYGRNIELTRTEFDLLLALLRSGRRVRSKADLVLALRGESYVTSYFVQESDKRAVEVHIANLRKKLGENTNNPIWIETVRGIGYRLAA